MELNKYQFKALETAEYPSVGKNILYPVLGLVGEAGEVAEVVKKAFRTNDRESTILGQALIETDRYGQSVLYSIPKKMLIAKELGDVLWYIAAIAGEMGMTLQEIADINLKKLAERREAGNISVTEKREEE